MSNENCQEKRNPDDEFHSVAFLVWFDGRLEVNSQKNQYKGGGGGEAYDTPVTGGNGPSYTGVGGGVLP